MLPEISYKVSILTSGNDAHSARDLNHADCIIKIIPLTAKNMLAAEIGERDLAICSLNAALSQAGRALPQPAPLDTGISVPTLRLALARALLAGKRPPKVPAALADLVAKGAPNVLLLVGQAQLDAGPPGSPAWADHRAGSWPATH